MKYYKKIDGLRFVAILLVLIEHFAGYFGKYIYPGYYGVVLFFVISGFLITSILLKPNDLSFKTNYLNFLGRRTLRIFPIYYITLLLLWLLKMEDVRSYMLYLLTYTFNYRVIDVGLPEAPIRHFWSLCVEEQFYLLWPFVILSFKKNNLLLILVICGIIILGYTQIIFNVFPAWEKYNGWGLFPVMAFLAMGALGALIVKNQLLPGMLYKSKILEISMLIFWILVLLIPFQFRPFLFGLTSLYFVLKAAQNDFQLPMLNTFLGNRFIMFVGTISYGIYLFHPPLEYLMTKYIFNPIWLNIDFAALGFMERLQWHSWIIKFPLYSALSIILASLSYKYIEQPILRLKNKFFPVDQHPPHRVDQQLHSELMLEKAKMSEGK